MYRRLPSSLNARLNKDTAQLSACMPVYVVRYITQYKPAYSWSCTVYLMRPSRPKLAGHALFDSESTMPLHSACVGMYVYCQVSRIYAGFITDYTPSV